MSDAAFAAVALVLGLDALYFGLSPQGPKPLAFANGIALAALVTAALFG